MILKSGNLFDPNLKDAPDLRLFTANGVVKRNGELVMGAGAAKMAKQLDPTAPAVFGRLAREEGAYDERYGAYVYGLLVDRELGLGAFQTKFHYRGRASIDLIALAAQKLAVFTSRNPGLRIGVNFPGVGLGRLDRMSVQAVLEEFWWDLPIEVWRFSPRRLPANAPVYRLPVKSGT
ncbi:hypothetical protein Ocepr_2289 (plasmid) [Oceanithermus profundus DSM 14977]|uniref:Appr-1-p processing protein n=1 Tax=Oceanithermus profundus (strain DSM 14977 / NBRC 100410 / VKM B-2274 / 506) TaxID=670487 RepID=E4UAV2_OCEP5|nr:hypothetical protein [Oceanithermus profundus]ADR37737.1 hypothetical protein Ocepr_2289 [Oceanithermus profundus DSM 14977]